MAVLKDHIDYFEEIFGLDGFLQDPALVFGFQDCFLDYTIPITQKITRHIKHWVTTLSRGTRGRPGKSIYHDHGIVPPKMQCKNLQQMLNNYGLTKVTTLDYFDKRADIIFDMNNPLDPSYRESFATVIDIGSTEHVFDTRTCMSNLLMSCKVGGHFFMHTPCNGYFKHGFHTFNPEGIIQTLEINGFQIRYVKYSTPDGIEVEYPDMVYSAIIWIVAKKTASMNMFIAPQQGEWAVRYKDRK